MKQILTIAFLLSLTSIAKAQYPFCGYEMGINAMNLQHNAYKENIERTFELHKSYSFNRNNEVLKIKVVFHIVYKDSVENITDEKIYEQLNELNRCFRRMNPDTINTRNDFLEVVGDANIEFEIEEIIRVKTTKDFDPTLFALPDIVKETSKGGSDAINPDNFLNIWICELQPIDIFGSKSPLLGYAYPPVGLSHWPDGSAAPSKTLEGVVLDYRTIGLGEFEIPNMGSIPMLGRTCVHEVGHYLGLRHISGDGSAFGGVSCDGNDGVDDTPPQGKQSEFNCDHSQNTCNASAANDLPDMIENYMDYSKEDCQNSFTKGQIDIMRNVLFGVRNGLIEGVSSQDDNDYAVLNVYPNPSNGLFKISSERNYKNYQVYNEIDLSNKFNGIYFLTLITENYKPLIYKLIKN